MVFKLDSRWPLVWRSPDSIQVGVDRPLLVLDQVTAAQERLIAALVAGVARSGLDMLAQNSTDVDELLHRLEPAMVDESAERAAIRVHGGGPTAHRLRGLVADGDGPVVIIAHHVVSPELHGHWLRRDIPHLPVVYGDAVVRIGPFIEPGVGPCLYCLELHRTDADPAWPTIASQLLGRSAGTETALVATEVAAIVTRLVMRRATAGPGPATSIELEVSTGRTLERRWRRHPDCQCGGVEATTPTPRGNASASVLQFSPTPSSPRTGADAVAPA